MGDIIRERGEKRERDNTYHWPTLGGGRGGGKIRKRGGPVITKGGRIPSQWIIISMAWTWHRWSVQSLPWWLNQEEVLVAIVVRRNGNKNPEPEKDKERHGKIER